MKHGSRGRGALREVGAAEERPAVGRAEDVIGQPPLPVSAWTASM